MTPAVKQLHAKMTDGRGNFRRGALSRVSEYLDVHRSTLKKWFSEEWTPGAEKLQAIAVLLRDKSVRFSAHRTGPKVPVS